MGQKYHAHWGDIVLKVLFVFDYSIYCVFWTRETGTGQQVAQLHDRYMMMMICCVSCTVVVLTSSVICGCVYVWICNVWICVYMGDVMCWCFDNICICSYSVFYCFYCLFVLFSLCIFTLICY